jgi:uncharacterized protein (DUF885 family)
MSGSPKKPNEQDERMTTPLHRTLRLAPYLLAVVIAVAAASAAQAATSASETRKVNALFERHWAYVARTFPEGSTYRGDHRYGARLSDASAAGRAANDAQTRRWLAEARKIARGKLTPTGRVSLDLFIDDHERAVAMMAFAGYRSMSIGALGGVQTDFADLMQVTPMQTRAQARQLIDRQAAVPRRLDDEIAHLREGMRLGWVPPREVLDRALEQIDKQLAPAPEDGPFYKPFQQLPASMSAAERAELQTAGRASVERHVLPALRKLRAFVADEYRAKAAANGALSGYPDGKRVYELLVREQTTTKLGAREIHDIGLRELSRIRGEMEAVMREVKFEGDFTKFIDFLDTDPRFKYANADALLTHYRDIGKRLDAEMPKLFAELPRAAWGVKAMPAHIGADSAEYYQSPAQDGSRAGFFFANAQSWQRKRTWEAETLVAHEAVPGHHLQGARALELRGLPDFRRNAFYTAYGEGWALYAETLGADLGLYTDPYSRFGHLQWQAFRAARLVVDTGIHAFGWSRERAIDFMVERTGVARVFVTSEVDRYTSDPGQALAYMIGKLKIDELRDRAKKKLGAKFDIRRFHNLLLDQGALPLDVLERVADEWTAAQARAASNDQRGGKRLIAARQRTALLR